MAILVDKNSKIVIQGITGREASMVTKQALAYGTKILAGVTPGKEGQFVEGVPVYNTLKRACKNTELNTSVIYVPPASAYDAVMEAISNGMKLILVVTERVPKHDAAKFILAAKEANCTLVGPNTGGIINPGDRIKLGPPGGSNPERAFVAGEVGVVSRSGGMAQECSWMIKRAGFGITTAIHVGGDPLVGTPPKTILGMFEKDPKTKAVVMWVEPGTNYEEDVADFIREGGFTKPLIACIGGRFIEEIPEGTIFGHAAAIVERGVGKPSHKMARLRDAGCYVVENWDDISTILKDVLS